MTHIHTHTQNDLVPPLRSLDPVSVSPRFFCSRVQGVQHPGHARHLLGGEGAPVGCARPRAGQGAFRGARHRLARCLCGGYLLHPRDKHLAHRVPGLHPAALRGWRAPGADFLGPARCLLDPEAERKVKKQFFFCGIGGGGGGWEKSFILYLIFRREYELLVEGVMKSSLSDCHGTRW